MTINVARIKNGLENRYLHYLSTLFPISDQELKKLFTEELESGEFIRGPFIEITPPYEKGLSLQDLVNREILSNTFLGFPKGVFPEIFYHHQSEALLKVISENKNIVVASGTGSGKTESFLIPILNTLFSQMKNGEIDPGVRALLLYPMNALVNDQLDRLRGILQHFHPITFGRYTGETEENYEDALSKYQRIHGLNSKPLPNEIICREDMRKRPPHILLTNYAMLEYLLLRPDDNVFFSGKDAKFWKYIVIDEAHIYSGAKGLEISMLLRRLKDQIVLSEKGKITCIATSATLGSEAGKKDVAKFANQLFNEDFNEDSIISAKRVDDSAIDSWKSIPNPEYYQDIVELFGNNKDIEKISLDECVRKSKERNVDPEAINYAIGLTQDPREFIYHIFVRDPRLKALKIALKNGTDSLINVAEKIFNDSSNIEISLISLIEAASIQYCDHLPPLLSARYHLFLKAAEGAFITLIPEKNVHLKPLKSNPFYSIKTHNKKLENSSAFELGTCKYCGAPFLIGKIDKEGTKKIFRQNINPDSEADKSQNNIYISFVSSNIDETENQDDFTQLNIKKPYKIEPNILCGLCGRISKKGAINDYCGHDNDYLIDVNIITPDNVSNELHKCPFCSKVSPHSPVVMRFLTGKDAVPAVLATELYQQLPDKYFECNKSHNNKIDCYKRNLLVFSDSRQDAAFFAPYLENTYHKINRRRMLCSVIADNIASITHHQWNIFSFSDYLIKEAYNINLFCCNKKLENNLVNIENLIKKWLIYEIVPRGDKGSLESLGLMGYVPKFSSSFKIPDVLHQSPWNFSDDEANSLCQILFDQFRLKGAICYPDGIIAKDTFFSPLNRDYFFKEKADPTSTTYSWMPSAKPKGGLYPNNRTDFLIKIGKKKKIQLTDNLIQDTLTAIWNSFRYLLIEDKFGKFQANPESWEVTSSLLGSDKYQWFYCEKCGKLTVLNIFNLCPEYRCAGTLKPCDPQSKFKENHYYQLYHNFTPVRLKACEHTAQLTQETAAKIQENFKIGKINLISSSTTFELGVDIGELECVFMRNLPPNPANYIQRAGRAGRRTGTAAVAVTFCQRRPHDLSFYNKTDDYVNGVVRTPRIDVMNRKIVTRHLFSVIFSEFWKENGSTFKNVGSLFFDENDGKIDAIQKFSEFLDNKNISLKESLQRISPHELFPDEFFENWEISQLLISENSSPDLGRLSKVSRSIQVDIDLLEKRRKQYRDEEEDFKAGEIKNVIKLIKDRKTIDYLSTHNILPKYGFPVDVVSLEILYRAKIAEKLDLSRDLSIALSEYAPGSKVVAGGKVWESRYIKKNPQNNAIIKMAYSICKTCNRYQSDYLEKKSDLSICPTCKTKIEVKNMGVAYLPRFGFTASTDPPQDIGEFRPEKTHSTRVYYSGEKDEIFPKHKFSTKIFDLMVKGWAAPNGKLALINNAHNNGFAVCPFCGFALVNKGNLPPSHEDAAGNTCSGNLQYIQPELKCKIHLGHEFLTDICYISFPGVTDTNDFWNSLLYAILEGACDALAIERADINGCLFAGEDGVQSRSLILYDGVPGGAGLVKRIMETEDNLKLVLKSAYKRLDDCTCGGEVGDGSCYSCLRNFNNQFCHDQLNRGIVIDFLNKHGFKR